MTPPRKHLIDSAKQRNRRTSAAMAALDDGTAFIRPPQGYGPLGCVLGDAIDQAAFGKGRERHAQPGLAFMDQPMMKTTAAVGVGFPLGQAIKKAEEAKGMMDRGDVAAAQRELLGAIVYLAGAHIAMGDGGKCNGGEKLKTTHRPDAGIYMRTPMEWRRRKSSSPSRKGRSPRLPKFMAARFSTVRSWLGQFLECDVFRG